MYEWFPCLVLVGLGLGPLMDLVIQIDPRLVNIMVNKLNSF